MEVISNKTIEEINNQTDLLMKEKLPKLTGPIINNFLKINDENLFSLYSDVNNLHKALIFSTAENTYLDDKGKLFNCNRLTGEEDNSFRVRISNSNVSNAKGNFTSLESILYEDEEIKDLKFEEFTFGSGSFSVVVLTDYLKTPQVILDRVKERIQQDKSYGNRFEVISPKIMEVALTIKVFLNKNVDDANSIYILNEIKTNIKTYINSLKIAEAIDVNVIKTLLLSNKDVKSYSVVTFMINNEDKNFNKQTCNWNERFLEQGIIDSINII